MNQYDDLFSQENKNNFAEKNKNTSFNKDAWIEKKKQERAEAYELLDTATVEIIKDAERFKDFLNTQAQFDRYSVSNAILIAYQHPGATKVADFAQWKEENISVKKGEKAITMLEPGSEFTREDGTTGFSVNVKKVFDISQTSGDKIKKHNTKPDERAAIKALIASAPCEVVLVDELQNSNARYSPENGKIFILKGLEADEIFRSLSFEIGIAMSSQKKIARNDAMFPSYCSAYILCERYGFNTDSFDFEKVPEQFDGKEAKEARKSLGAIRELANDIGQEMTRQFEAMEKSNRSKDTGAR